MGFSPANPIAGPLNLTITRDKTTYFGFWVTQADGVTPYDLTDAVVWFHAAVGAVSIDKSSPSSGIDITSPTGGTATLQFEPADTSAIPAGGTYSVPCELTVVDGGESYQAASGTLTITPNVGTP